MKQEFYKRAIILSYFTVGYNILEGLVSILVGTAKSSIALIGFGLDSFVESLSGGITIWRFSQGNNFSQSEEAKIESQTSKLVALTFFILAGYVLFQSLKKLVLREVPQPTLVGILVAGVSLIVMPILFYAKYRLGKKIDSVSLIADSKQTLARVFLSASLINWIGIKLFLWFLASRPVGRINCGSLFNSRRF